jgi:hypothetical protein
MAWFDISFGILRCLIAREDLFYLVEYFIQTQPVDQLHDIVVHAAFLSDTEDGDDVGVVQLGGSLGLANEASSLLFVGQSVLRQQFQGYSPAKRFLLRLVDDAHPTPTEFAYDPVIAKLFDVGVKNHASLSCESSRNGLAVAASESANPMPCGSIGLEVVVENSCGAPHRDGWAIIPFLLGTSNQMQKVVGLKREKDSVRRK